MASLVASRQRAFSLVVARRYLRALDQQPLRDVEVPAAGGQDQGGVASLIDMMDLGLPGQQFHGGGVSLSGRQQQRGVALGCHGVQGVAMGEQQGYGIGMPAGSGEHERAVAGLSGEAGNGLQQPTHRIYLTLAYGQAEG